jgi:DNA-directed RNA polymerase subunit RPC12/RpoP
MIARCLRCGEEFVTGDYPENECDACKLSTLMEPSERAQQMLERAKAAANREVQKHLAAGRSVYGRRDGEPITIEPLLRRSSFGVCNEHDLDNCDECGFHNGRYDE